jgi:chemotaxis protein MotB
MPTVRPIIIVKKKVNHGGHHGGAWKVAYADFVTAMMALFIVLWLMNSSQKVRQAVGGYFKDPSGKANLEGSDKAGAGENFVLNKDNMEDLKKQLQKAIYKVPELNNIKNHIDMTVTNEGLRIELTESAAGTFFESGSSQISPEGRALLILLAQELGKLPNKIAFEGHTDAKPYAKAGNYGNWELSADRANAARRLMQQQGIAEGQVTQVRGFADQRLRKPDNPLDPSNRRISLIVQYVEKPPELSLPKENQSPEGEGTKPDGGPAKADGEGAKVEGGGATPAQQQKK